MFNYEPFVCAVIFGAFFVYISWWIIRNEREARKRVRMTNEEYNEYKNAGSSP